MCSCQLTVLLCWSKAQLSWCLFRKELLGPQAPACGGWEGVSLAQLSTGKCKFKRILWKFCLHLQWCVLLKSLTCLQRSSQSSRHGVVEPDPGACWLRVYTSNDEWCSAWSQHACLMLLDELEKQKNALSFSTSEANLTIRCRPPQSAATSSHWPYTLSLLVSFAQNCK